MNYRLILPRSIHLGCVFDTSIPIDQGADLLSVKVFGVSEVCYSDLTATKPARVPSHSYRRSEGDPVLTVQIGAHEPFTL